MNKFFRFLMLFASCMVCTMASSQQTMTFLSGSEKLQSYTEKLDSFATMKLSSFGDEEFRMFLYDALGRVVTIKSFEGTNSNSFIRSQEQFYYNPAGLTDSVVTTGAASGIWNRRITQVFFYTGTQVDSTVTITIPNLNKPDEYYAHASSYQYNVWGGQTQSVNYSKANSNAPWIPKEMKFSIYDMLHRITNDSLYYYHQTSGTWRLSRYYWYLYDFNNGHLTEKAIYIVSGASFLPLEKTNYLYDLSGKLIREEVFMWDMDQNMNYTWIRFMAFVYSFDIYGNITEETWYDGSEWPPYWLPSSKSRATYGLELVSNTALPAFFSGSTFFRINRPLEILFMDTTQTSKLLRSRSYYYYSGGIGIKEILPKGRLAVCPNPTSSTLHITLPTPYAGRNRIKMITPGGSYTEVPFTILSATSLVADLSKLPAGVYVLLLTDENGNQYSEKIIKLR